MKDFFGKGLAVGDIVALLQKAGSSSVYIRQGTVVGFTKKQVVVEFVPQGFKEPDVDVVYRDPQNIIKK